MADFFAAEAFEVLRYVLGPNRDGALRKRLSRLCALADQVRDRPALARAWDNRPSRFTARPDEDVVIDRLHAVDLSPIGL